MKKNNQKPESFLIETDILIDFLSNAGRNRSSDLLMLMQKGICFTSVINAAEVYFKSRSDFEKEKIDHLFYALKVIGMHSRYSLQIPEISEFFDNYRDALIYIISRQNNLLIVTHDPERYNFSGTRAKSPSELL